MPDPNPNPNPSPAPNPAPNPNPSPAPNPTPNPTPNPAPNPTPEFFIKPDGTYVEKFYEHPSFPKEFADNLQLRTHTGIADTLKNWATLEKIRGHHVVPVPAANSDDATWGLVADRLGRPKTPGEYKLPDPKAAGLEEKALAPKEFIEGVLTDMHESELTQRQAERLLTRWNKRVAAFGAARQQALAAAQAEELKPLRTTWGAEFDTRRTLVESFLRARVPADRFDRVLALGVLDEPGLLAPLHEIAMALGEKPPDLGTPAPANVLAAAETEVAQLQADKAYNDEYDPRHGQVVKRVNELRAVLFAAKKK
jgi:hypothetical protein